MPGVSAALSAPSAAVDVATGIVVLIAGFAALARGRGALLAATGAAWLAGDVWDRLLYVHRGPLAQLALARSPLTAVVYVDGVIGPLARAPWPTLALCMAVVAAARGHRLATAAVAGALAFESAGRIVGVDTATVAAWWYDGAVTGVALAIALRAPDRLPARLVIDLGAEPGAIQAALARALGDPALEVRYRVGTGWVDEGGRPTPAPGPDARLIDDRAALLHGPGTLRDPVLGQAVDAAVRLAMANVRLQADVAERVRDVERSRRRLVEAGAAERRRLREQLGSGAERHLDAAAAALAVPPQAEALRAELAAAQADVSRFAQGIHPRMLTERGLAAALAELGPAARLDIEDRRFPGPQETVAFFVCAESLANVAKYAPSARVDVTVRADDARLRIRIADNGPGGADATRGSGLRGLADRVEALGGHLIVDSAPGAGTRVEADLPLALRPM